MSATLPAITHTPTSTRVERKRTFTLNSGRADYDDVVAQFLVLLRQLHGERFTGNLQLNFNSGSINTCETTSREK